MPTKLWEGNVSTGVCQLICPGGGSSAGYMDLGYYGIPLTNGLYASYWNAFLKKRFHLFKALNSMNLTLTTELKRLKIFRRELVLFVGPLILLFWTSVDRRTPYLCVFTPVHDGRRFSVAPGNLMAANMAVKAFTHILFQSVARVKSMHIVCRSLAL